MVAAGKSRKSDSRSDLRREAILKSAIDLFINHGYAGTSTSAIVERSGGSKQTVYAYFGNKEGLFRAAVDSLIESAFVALDVPSTDPAKPRAALRRIAMDALTVTSTPENFELFRLIIAEGSRLGAVRDSVFSFEDSPGMPIDRLAKFLRRCVAAGTLRVRNPETYAYVYLGMVSQAFLRALLVGERLTSDQIVRHTNTIVPVFMHMCEVEPAKTTRSAPSKPIATHTGAKRR